MSTLLRAFKGFKGHVLRPQCLITDLLCHSGTSTEWFAIEPFLLSVVVSAIYLYLPARRQSCSMPGRDATVKVKNVKNIKTRSTITRLSRCGERAAGVERVHWGAKH